MVDSKTQLNFGRIMALNDAIITIDGDGFYGDGSKLTNLNIADGTITNITTGDGLSGGPITTTGSISVDDTIITKNSVNQITGSVTNTDIIFSNKSLNVSDLRLNNINVDLDLNQKTITNLQETNDINSIITRNKLDTKLDENYNYLDNIFLANNNGVLVDNYSFNLNNNNILLLGDPIDNNDAINIDHFDKNNQEIDSTTGLTYQMVNKYKHIKLNLSSNSGLKLNNDGLTINMDFSLLGPIKLPTYYSFSLPKYSAGIVYVKDAIVTTTADNNIIGVNRPTISMGHILSNISGLQNSLSTIKWLNLYDGEITKCSLPSYNDSYCECEKQVRSDGAPAWDAQINP